MDPKQISLSSPIAFAVIVPLVAGLWGMYMFVAPKFAMITTNNIELQSTKARVERIDIKVEKTTEKYNDNMIDIASSLSDIKAQLKMIREDRHIKNGRK